MIAAASVIEKKFYNTDTKRNHLMFKIVIFYRLFAYLLLNLCLNMPKCFNLSDFMSSLTFAGMIVEKYTSIGQMPVGQKVIGRKVRNLRK